MKEILLDELKEIQLEMLKAIDDFCRINGIKYFLSAGTLIGAVRHQGYIPWDDDIDIMMLRPDYDKFIHSFNNHYEDLDVCAPELNWNYYAPYANVFHNKTLLIEDNMNHMGMKLGIKIDIFPLDAIPQNELRYTIERNLVLRLNGILIAKRTKRVSSLSRNQKIARILFSQVPYSIIQKMIKKIATSVKFNDSTDVFLRTFDITKPMRANKALFNNSVYVPFEKYYFPIPSGYDEYLRIRYGNYMQLPPEGERIPHHGFKAYWK